MTDDEFQRLKDAEKKHLRAKKRLQRTLKALKQRNEVQGVVRRMKQGARHLLEETESLVDSLRRSVAKREARFEVALDEEDEDMDLHEAEETLREERAEALVQKFKQEESQSTSSRPHASDREDDASSDDVDESGQNGPDKTIGRMGGLRSDDAS